MFWNKSGLRCSSLDWKITVDRERVLKKKKCFPDRISMSGGVHHNSSQIGRLYYGAILTVFLDCYRRLDSIFTRTDFKLKFKVNAMSTRVPLTALPVISTQGESSHFNTKGEKRKKKIHDGFEEHTCLKQHPTEITNHPWVCKTIYLFKKGLL